MACILTVINIIPTVLTSFVGVTVRMPQGHLNNKEINKQTNKQTSKQTNHLDWKVSDFSLFLFFLLWLKNGKNKHTKQANFGQWFHSWKSMAVKNLESLHGSDKTNPPWLLVSTTLKICSAFLLSNFRTFQGKKIPKTTSEWNPPPKDLARELWGSKHYW